MKLINTEDVKINYLQLIYLNPFPSEKIQEVIDSSKKCIAVENNITSQISSLIREHILRTVDNKILKYDGRPFDPKASCP